MGIYPTTPLPLHSSRICICHLLPSRIAPSDQEELTTIHCGHFPLYCFRVRSGTRSQPEQRLFLHRWVGGGEENWHWHLQSKFYKRSMASRVKLYCITDCVSIFNSHINLSHSWIIAPNFFTNGKTSVIYHHILRSCGTILFHRKKCGIVLFVLYSLNLAFESQRVYT